jgi:hypothetical protein
MGMNKDKLKFMLLIADPLPIVDGGIVVGARPWIAWQFKA